MGCQVRILESFGHMTSLFPDGMWTKGAWCALARVVLCLSPSKIAQSPGGRKTHLRSHWPGRDQHRALGSTFPQTRYNVLAKRGVLLPRLAGGHAGWRSLGGDQCTLVWSSPWPCVLMEVCPDPMGLSPRRSLRGVEATGCTHATPVNGPADLYHRALRFRSMYKTAQILQHIGLLLLRQFPLNKR